MAHHLVAWLIEFGPAVLFVAQVFGIIGLPIPDEFLMTVAGALVHRGQLHAVPTVTAAAAGCITGITFSYMLGRTIGLHAIERYVRVHKDAVARAQGWFQRFGGWLLVFGYFIPGVRHVSAIAAGSSGFTFGRFARFAYPGAVLWCAVFLTAGYVGGEQFEAVIASVRGHVRVAALVAVAAALVYLVILRLRRSAL